MIQPQRNTPIQILHYNLIDGYCNHLIGLELRQCEIFSFERCELKGDITICLRYVISQRKTKKAIIVKEGFKYVKLIELTDYEITSLNNLIKQIKEQIKLSHK